MTRTFSFSTSCFFCDAIAPLLVTSALLLAFTAAGMAQNPVPLINQPLVPDAKRPGGAAFTLTVNGTGFVPGAVVKWNGLARTTTFVSSSRLTARIQTADVAKAGTASIVVVNPRPGGGTSNIVSFQVTLPSLSVGLSGADFSVLGYPFAVAAGDFNGDHLQDLAVLHNDNNNVAILLGRGDGTFWPVVGYQAATAPSSLTLADFNNDSKLDLAVVNGDGVNVLLGNGDGTFGPPATYAAGNTPVAIAVGDFNRDGKLDVVVANTYDEITVLMGNGDGSFGLGRSFSTGIQPGSVAVGDFNGDGKLDVAVAHIGSNDFSILLGNGDGTFQAAQSYAPGGYAIAAADFNGDGKLDIITANIGSLAVLLGNGDGTFQAPANYNVGSDITSLAVGDFNGDRRLDVAVSSAGSSDLVILLGNGDGTFQPELHDMGGSGEALAVGDFNRDGRLDLAVTDYTPRAISVLLQAILSPGSLTFATQLVGTSSSPQSAALNNYTANPLVISSITVSGDFSQNNNCGSSLPPGANCTINVTFTPALRGTRSGLLSITDNVLGSPQTVSLTGVGTVVTFNRSSLNFGKVTVGRYKTATTTLTNTGSTTLKISGVISVPNPPFSQTNDCGTLVKPGKFCTISVTFAPKTNRSYTGELQVSDNGGGSPQRVSLSGRGFGSSLSQLEVRSAVAADNTAAVPAPTGPNPVGTRVMDLVDSSRDDPFAANGSKRELLVRFWYPASLTQDCEPAQYTSPEMWSYFSQLAGIPLPEVRTNSCQDAPIAAGAHPMVLFTPGYTSTFTDYTFLFEDLASRGYVVASLDHTYEATAVEFPDGRFVKSKFGSHLAADTLPTDHQALTSALLVRLSDLKFIVNELQRLNARIDNPFAGKLDTSRIAVAGHSLGGLAALLGAEQEARFGAGILIDGDVPDALVKATDTPIFVVAMGQQWSSEECLLWSDLHGPRLAVNLQGAEHLTPSDAVWLAKGAIKTGTMGPEKTIEALRNYIAAFLDTNLRGKPMDPLLAGPSSAYPDAVVTTQKESLCGTR